MTASTRQMNKGKNLQDAVSELRRALGLNQAMFARRIGVSTSTVYRWETQKPPRGPVLTRLSELAASLQRIDLQGVFKLAMGEPVTPPPAPVDNAEIPRPLQPYLQRLAEILASGDAMAIDAVTRNIDFFRDRLRPAGHKGR